MPARSLDADELLLDAAADAGVKLPSPLRATRDGPEALAVPPPRALSNFAERQLRRAGQSSASDSVGRGSAHPLLAPAAAMDVKPSSALRVGAAPPLSASVPAPVAAPGPPLPQAKAPPSSSASAKPVQPPPSATPTVGLQLRSAVEPSGGAGGESRKSSPHSASAPSRQVSGRIPASDSEGERPAGSLRSRDPSVRLSGGGGGAESGAETDVEEGGEVDRAGRAIVKGYAAGNVEGREKFGKTTVATTGALMPTIAPGSPLDLALQAKVHKKKRLPRAHKPDALKRLQQGAQEFERRKAAKALGKIINKEHTFYHLSYGMMLGIYTSVVHSSNSTGWVGTGVLGAARPPTLGPGSARVPRPEGSRERSASSVARSNTLTAAALAAHAALEGGPSLVAVPRKLVLEDFMAVRKLEFPKEGSALTPPHALPRTFKFKDYAPSVFHSLRHRFSIDPQHYLRSLGGAYEYIEFASNSKSGSFFFYSHDGKFMIKTQNKTESKFLRRILAHYHAYVMDNPFTYITRFYGLHRIKMPHIRRKIHFVVMQSVFFGENDIHEMYDLKGSTIGRAATKAERACGPSGCVYKDMDLEERGTMVRMGPGRREAFLAQLGKDAAFLESLGIMDYSLLLGVHHRSAAATAAGHMLLGHGQLPPAGGEGEEEEEEGGGDEGTVRPGLGSGGLREMPAVLAGTRVTPSSPGAKPSISATRDDSEAPGSPIVGGRAGEGFPLRAGADVIVEAATGVISPRYATEAPEAGQREEGEDSGMESAASDADASASASEVEGGAEGGDGAGPHRQGPRMRRAGSRRGSTRRAGRPASDEELLGLQYSPDGSVAPPAPTEAGGGGIAGMTPAGHPADDIYYLGIIDILQQYDARKMGETVLKSFVHPVAGISSVSPSFYAARFVDFLTRHVV